jgi:t-SNARE complex subunit (syntaxin)
MYIEQDAQLDDLAAILSRQQEISHHLATELDTQAAMLDHVEQGLSDTERRARASRQQVLRARAEKQRRDKRVVAVLGVLIVVLVVVIAVTKGGRK